MCQKLLRVWRSLWLMGNFFLRARKFSLSFIILLFFKHCFIFIFISLLETKEYRTTEENIILNIVECPQLYIIIFCISCAFDYTCQDFVFWPFFSPKIQTVQELMKGRKYQELQLATLNYDMYCSPYFPEKLYISINILLFFNVERKVHENIQQLDVYFHPPYLSSFYVTL